MKIKVEKGLPIPEDVRGTGYPFDEMKVGDSFAMPARRKTSVRGAIFTRKRAGQPGKFITRAVVENGVDMVRCWRVE